MAELDWRNPDDYAYLEGCNLHQWAWEFLRRNRAYRDAYFAYEPYSDMEYHGRLDTPEKRQRYGELFRAASAPWGLACAVDPRLNYKEAYPIFDGAVGVNMPMSWKAAPLLRSHLWPGYPHQVAFVFDFRYSGKTTPAWGKTRVAGASCRPLNQLESGGSLKDPPKGTQEDRTDPTPECPR